MKQPSTQKVKTAHMKYENNLKDYMVKLLYREGKTYITELSHSVETHKKHYQKLDTVAGAAQAHQIVQGLTKATSSSSSSRPKQTRRQYSHTELVDITSEFSRQIAEQRSISLGEAREFPKKNKL